jgi:hypothetical protein
VLTNDNAGMSERINMASETINHRALDNNCEKLAALITRHTNGKGNGSHPTALDKLKFNH